jgi:hypothetical protein
MRTQGITARALVVTEPADLRSPFGPLAGHVCRLCADLLDGGLDPSFTRNRCARKELWCCHPGWAIFSGDGRTRFVNGLDLAMDNSDAARELQQHAREVPVGDAARRGSNCAKAPAGRGGLADMDVLATRNARSQVRGEGAGMDAGGVRRGWLSGLADGDR